MNMGHRHRAAALLLGIVPWLAGGAAATESIYKWVDENGQVNYSSHPPPGVEGQRIQGPPRHDATPALQALEAREAAFDERRAAAARAAAEQAAEEAGAARRAQHCAQLRQRLERLSNAQRLYEEDAQGLPMRLGEPERQARLAETRAALEADCR